jgi:hypothetical protein
MSKLPILSGFFKQVVPLAVVNRGVRGRRTEDQSGKMLSDERAACERAVQRTPARLKRADHDSYNTYVATEVTHGQNTLYVVRGTVIVEKR